MLWISSQAITGDAIKNASKSPDYSSIFHVVIHTPTTHIQTDLCRMPVPNILASLPQTVLPTVPQPGSPGAVIDQVALRHISAARSAAEKEILELVKMRQQELDTLVSRARAEAQALMDSCTTTDAPPAQSLSRSPRTPSGLSASLSRHAAGPLESAYIESQSVGSDASDHLHEMEAREPFPRVTSSRRPKELISKDTSANKGTTGGSELVREDYMDAEPAPLLQETEGTPTADDNSPVFAIDEDVDMVQSKAPPLAQAAGDKSQRISHDPVLDQLHLSGGSFSALPRMHGPRADLASSLKRGPYDLADAPDESRKSKPMVDAEEMSHVGLSAPSHRSRTLHELKLSSVPTEKEHTGVPQIHAPTRESKSSSSTPNINHRSHPFGFMPELPVAPSANTRTSGQGDPLPLCYTDDMSNDPELDTLKLMHYLQNLKVRQL